MFRNTNCKPLGKRFLTLSLSVILMLAIGVHAQLPSLEVERLESKAKEYLAHIPDHLQENQVLSKTPPSAPQPFDEEGDAATYTAYLLAAEAMRYRATNDATAVANVRAFSAALNRLHAASGTPGVLSRFIHPDGTPHLKSRSFSSKDVYTGVLFGYSWSYPLLDDSEKLEVASIIRAIGDLFLSEGPAKPKYSFIGAYSGPGERNPKQPDGHKTFVSFTPSFDLALINYMAETSPTRLVAFANTLSDLRDMKNIEKSLSAIKKVLKHLRNQCDSMQDYTDGDVRAIQRAAEELADFLLSLRGEGQFGGPVAQRQISHFVSEIIFESKGSRNFERVFRDHWTGGVTHLLNYAVKVFHNLPEHLPPMVRLVRHIFGSNERFYGWLENTWAGQDDPSLVISAGVFAVEYAKKRLECVIFRRNIDGLRRFGRRLERNIRREIRRTERNVRNEIRRLRRRLGFAPSPFMMDAQPVEIDNTASNDVKTLDNALTPDHVEPEADFDDSTEGQELLESTSGGFSGLDLSSMAVAAVGPEKVLRAKARVEAVKSFLFHEGQSYAALRELVNLLPGSIGRPEDLRIDIGDNSLLGLHVLKVCHQITGEAKFADEYNRIKSEWLSINVRFGTALDKALTKMFGDSYRDAMEIQGTHALKWIALWDLLRLETDPQAKKLLLSIARQKFAYERDELNSMVNFINAAFAGAGTASIREGLEQLKLFPRYVDDYSDYCPSPHPVIPGFCSETDERISRQFGGYISFLNQEGSQGSRLSMPLNLRPRDAFTWQRSPRRLTNGNKLTFPGIDYLLAYGMALEYNFFSSTGGGSGGGETRSVPVCVDADHVHVPSGLEGDCGALATNYQARLVALDRDTRTVLEQTERADERSAILESCRLQRKQLVLETNAALISGNCGGGLASSTTEVAVCAPSDLIHIPNNLDGICSDVARMYHSEFRSLDIRTADALRFTEVLEERTAIMESCRLQREQFLLQMNAAFSSTPCGAVDNPPGQSAIQILNASYGAGSCGTPDGNVTSTVASKCDGQKSCNIFVDNSVFGDPSPNCPKDFDVIWTCGENLSQYSAGHDPVVNEGYTVPIKCP